MSSKEFNPLSKAVAMKKRSIGRLFDDVAGRLVAFGWEVQTPRYTVARRGEFGNFVVDFQASKSSGPMCLFVNSHVQHVWPITQIGPGAYFQRIEAPEEMRVRFAQCWSTSDSTPERLAAAILSAALIVDFELN
jgi:hypothetical protein